MGDRITIGRTDKAHNEWIECQKVTEAECIQVIAVDTESFIEFLKGEAV